eukprot:jgi/Botrbrau1/21798/Bobra.0190s0023.1
MEGSSQQQDLLRGLEQPDRTYILGQLKNVKQADLQETLSCFPAKLLPAFCEAVCRQVDASLSSICGVEECSALEETDALQVLILLIGHFIKEKNMPCLQRLQPAAQALHDQALLAASAFPQLQDAVARMCLAWWEAGGPDRESLVTQTIPYTLVAALTSGRRADVKRCTALQEALGLLDFADESIADLERLLLRAAMWPPFLRFQEGRRFLSHLFSLKGQLVRELGAIIRNQIPCGRASVLEAYGAILCRAWRDTTGVCRLEVERLLQGLVHAAVHASSEAMARSLRKVLGQLHKLRGAPAIDTLLLQLYQPVIFRSLCVANPLVRHNTLQLFFDVFPLQDPTAMVEDVDELLNRQFGSITAALADPTPSVRAAAAKGVCALLDQFWELIPANVSVPYLKRLTEELAYDGASPAVRASVLEGLAVLVQNPMAHGVLGMLLPKVAHLLSDPSQRVRVALLDLLITVGTVRDLHFYDIVAVPALLEALALEEGPVRKRLQHLLVPSYCPDSQEAPARLAALLRSAPEAGRLFCRFICHSWAVEDKSRAKMLLEVCTAFEEELLASRTSELQAAPTKGKVRGGKRKQPVLHEDSSKPASALGTESPEVWGALFGGLAELSAGLGAALAPKPPAALKSLFSEDRLGQLFDHLFLGSSPTSSNCQAAATLLGASPMPLSPAFLSRWLPHILLCPLAGEDEEAMLSLLQGHQCAAVLDFLTGTLGAGGSPWASRALAVRLISAALEHLDARRHLLESQAVGAVAACLMQMAQDYCQRAADILAADDPQSESENFCWDGSLVRVVATALRLAVHLGLVHRDQTPGDLSADEPHLPQGELNPLETAKSVIRGCWDDGLQVLVQALVGTVPLAEESAPSPAHKAKIRKKERSSAPHGCDPPTFMLGSCIREAHGALLVGVSIAADALRLDACPVAPLLGGSAASSLAPLIPWMSRHRTQLPGFLGAGASGMVWHASRLTVGLFSAGALSTEHSDDDQHCAGGASGQLGQVAGALLEVLLACPEASPPPAQAGPLLSGLLSAACNDASHAGWVCSLGAAISGQEAASPLAAPVGGPDSGRLGPPEASSDAPGEAAKGSGALPDPAEGSGPSPDPVNAHCLAVEAVDGGGPAASNLNDKGRGWRDDQFGAKNDVLQLIRKAVVSLEVKSAALAGHLGGLQQHGDPSLRESAVKVLQFLKL